MEKNKGKKKTLKQTETELYYTQLKIGTSSKKLDFFERFHSRNLPFFSEGWICNKHHPPMPSPSHLESRFTWKWSCGGKKNWGVNQRWQPGRVNPRLNREYVCFQGCSIVIAVYRSSSRSSNSKTRRLRYLYVYMCLWKRNWVLREFKNVHFLEI